MEKKFDIALIGLAVMGQSLARNIESKGFSILTYNRTTEKAEEFIQKYGTENLDYRKDYASLVADLKRPRKLIILVKAGDPVDGVIADLIPHLEEGDIVIDGGNSYYKDSQRRYKELQEKGLQFVGMGVSGGEEGALRGPSIMPGCEPSVWNELKPILEAIAARDFNDGPCVTHVGTDGAGHYVKMVHNGIEYGIMQMMSEAYEMFKVIYGLSANEIGSIFEEYSKGKLSSFLFDIAVPVLTQKDEFNDGNLIDFILDKAGQKGTGRWTAIDALDQGQVLPTITEAVFSRSISSFKQQRVELSKMYDKPKAEPTLSLEEFKKELEDALYAGILSTYAQGFEQIRSMADVNEWQINFAEVARIWEGGCIIRADLLSFLHKAFDSAGGKAVHLFTIPDVRDALQTHLPAWRKITAFALGSGIPAPALATSLTYFEGMTNEVTSANMIQGLRDNFGAHTYQRIDREGTFHTPWSNLEL